MNWSGKRIGLALGGGGARGFAHIGVLDVLEQEDIKIDMIAGTSMGALMGAAYASGISPKELHRMTVSYLASPEFMNSSMRAISEAPEPQEEQWSGKFIRFFKSRFYMARTIFKPGVLPIEDFQTMIDYFLPDVRIEAMPIPFRAVATDLISGEKVIFSEGPLRRAVLASCAVPGAVDPIPEGEKLLADGGILSLVPVHTARAAGADIVIAVVVDRDIRYWNDFKTAKGIFFRAGDVASDNLKRIELQDADVIIRPDVGNSHWSDFSRTEELIRTGEVAAREAIINIDQAMPFYRRWYRRAAKVLPFGKQTSRHERDG